MIKSEKAGSTVRPPKEKEPLPDVGWRDRGSWATWRELELSVYTQVQGVGWRCSLATEAERK